MNHFICTYKSGFSALFPLLFLLASWQCKSTKQPTSGNCHLSGTVEDFSGLDGCRLLIVTASGEKLLPAEIEPSDFKLEAGQKIRFSYEELEGQTSICMAEDKIVRITCIELAKNENQLYASPCQNEEKLKPGTWLAELQKKHQANQITKFPYKTDGWAYLLKGKGYYLYDCQGTLIKGAKLAEDCMKGEITRPKEGVIIYPTGKEKN